MDSNDLGEFEKNGRQKEMQHLLSTVVKSSSGQLSTLVCDTKVLGEL